MATMSNIILSIWVVTHWKFHGLRWAPMGSYRRPRGTSLGRPRQRIWDIAGSRDKASPGRDGVSHGSPMGTHVETSVLEPLYLSYLTSSTIHSTSNRVEDWFVVGCVLGLPLLPRGLPRGLPHGLSSGLPRGLRRGLPRELLLEIPRGFPRG